jgi:hypothetical protein
LESVFLALVSEGKSFSDEGICLIEAIGLKVPSLLSMNEFFARHQFC